MINSKQTYKTVSFKDFGDIDKTIFIDILVRYSNEHDCEIQIVDDNADYEFCSVFGFDNIKDTGKCIKIFYTGENLRPDFNLFDYAIGFDYLSFDDRYFRFPFFYTSKDSEILSSESRDSSMLLQASGDRTKFCSFVVSNGCSANTCRDSLFHLLSDYKQVSSGGGHLNNIGERVKNKLEFEKQHKFSLCCENTSYKGYTTEKIVNAFAAGTIPIYYGDPTIGDVFNKKAFVNVLDYHSLSDVVERIKYIDNYDEVYRSMLSESILTDKHYTRACQLNELYGFICHILEQDINEARRVSTESFSGVYLRQYIKFISDHEKMTNIRKFKHPIKLFCR